jgi:hypothetical protein
LGNKVDNMTREVLDMRQRGKLCKHSITDGVHRLY